MISFGKSRELRMYWRVTREGRTSYLVGTSHFFPYSLRKSLARLLEDVDTVMLEGPLDRRSFDKVVTTGFSGSTESPLYDALDRETIDALNEVLFGDFLRRTDFSSVMELFKKKDGDMLLSLIKGLSPWMAFFTLWTYFLDERGWKYSVDLEAHEVAREMGKEVLFLEKIDEQIAVLEDIPLDRIVHFLRLCGKWEEYARRHASLYLKGDLEGQMALSRDFPSRCEQVIDKRDSVLYERMRPYFDRGRAAAFVGTAHTKNLREMFVRDGFAVTR